MTIWVGNREKASIEASLLATSWAVKMNLLTLTLTTEGKASSFFVPDLHSGRKISQIPTACANLCSERRDCCDPYARCTCGTHTGHFACSCARGFYGTGLKGDCKCELRGACSAESGVVCVTYSMQTCSRFLKAES